jgi:amino acid transporter
MIVKRSISLLFAFIGVALLCGVGIALSYRAVIIAFLCLVVFFLFMGFAFVYKARLRRRKNQ